MIFDLDALLTWIGGALGAVRRGRIHLSWRRSLSVKPKPAREEKLILVSTTSSCQGMMFRVETSSGVIDLQIRVEEVDKLRPHEETIPHALDTLKKSIRESGKLRNPVVVDSRSKVILDGTHRWAALREMGVKWIPTCGVDYFEPAIILDVWHRLYRLPSGARARDLLSTLNLPYTRGLSLEKPSIILRTADEEYCLQFEHVYEAYMSLKSMERILSAQFNLKPLYLPYPSKTLNGGFLLVSPPKLDKGEVVSLALAGRLLPPKSTRHIIPARPLGLDVPLSMLSSDEDPSSRVEAMLRNKTPLLLRPPVVLDREYDEAIIYFA